MARKVGAVKIQSVRGLTLFEKVRFALFGEHFLEDDSRKKTARYHRAQLFIDRISHAIKLETNSFETFRWPGVSNQEEYEIIKKFALEEAWKDAVEVFGKAIEEKDATILKDLAFILENVHTPVHPDRYVFGIFLIQFQTHRWPLPTAKVARAMLHSAGFDVDYKEIERLCDYYEVKLPKSPKKSH